MKRGREDEVVDLTGDEEARPEWRRAVVDLTTDDDDDDGRES